MEMMIAVVALYLTYIVVGKLDKAEPIVDNFVEESIVRSEVRIGKAEYQSVKEATKLNNSYEKLEAGGKAIHSVKSFRKKLKSIGKGD